MPEVGRIVLLQGVSPGTVRMLAERSRSTSHHDRDQPLVIMPHLVEHHNITREHTHFNGPARSPCPQTISAALLVPLQLVGAAELRRIIGCDKIVGSRRRTEWDWIAGFAAS